MSTYAENVAHTAQYLEQRLKERPAVGVITGTGLGDCARCLTVDHAVSYAEIPHFPVSTVESHPGRLLLGRMGAVPVAVLQGRFHLYEGYTPREVTFPVRVLRALGVSELILSNAAGGLNPAFGPGDLMLITDHINLTGETPLVGPNEDAWGIRFPDMGRAYPPDLVETAEAAAREAGLLTRKGVYAGLKGPSLETPAEIRFLRTIGADAVGLSTIQEVIAAVHGGMRVAGISIITNVHDPDRPAPATVEEIIAVANAAAPRLETLIRKITEKRDGS